MKDGKLLIGIIGCGGIANQKHMPALSKLDEKCVMTAFCDTVEERARKAAEQYGKGAGKVYTDYHELLADPEIYDPVVVQALINGINVLYPGVCVELTGHEKGLVIIENEMDIFRPWVLSFRDNKLYDLSNPSSCEGLELVDIMKTMDNRIKLDPDLLKEYEPCT